MAHGRRVGPGGAGALPATGQKKCYNSIGGEIACNSTDFPGQDGFYQAGCPKAGRLVDNGDGTVSDRCTGLMWQKATAPDSYTWQSALKYCDSLTLAGHSDWRLPNIRELLSIVDFGRSHPSIDPVFQAISSWYWSSSPLASWPIYAWIVDFDDGLGSNVAKGHGAYVRAVRSGP